MQITITIHGEHDIPPYNKTFRYQGYEDAAFVASCNRIREMISRGQKININEALLLLSALVISGLRRGTDSGGICRKLRGSLAADQVMIGVPEMLQRLDFDVMMDGRPYMVSVDRPIPVQDMAAGLAGES